MTTTPQSDMLPDEHMRTYTELVSLRSYAVSLVQTFNKEHAADNNARIVFTCDDCPRGAYCAYAFDSYNTAGDCLANWQ